MDDRQPCGAERLQVDDAIAPPAAFDDGRGHGTSVVRGIFAGEADCLLGRPAAIDRPLGIDANRPLTGDRRRTGAWSTPSSTYRVAIISPGALPLPPQA